MINVTLDVAMPIYKFYSWKFYLQDFEILHNTERRTHAKKPCQERFSTPARLYGNNSFLYQG